MCSFKMAERSGWTYSTAPPRRSSAIPPTTQAQGAPYLGYYPGPAGGSAGPAQEWGYRSSASAQESVGPDTGRGKAFGALTRSVPAGNVGIGGGVAKTDVVDGQSVGIPLSGVSEQPKGERVVLAKGRKEKNDYATMAEVYALIKATDHLERAWHRDAISSEDYQSGCWTLIQKYGALKASTKEVIPDMNRFVEEYNIQAPKGQYRLLKAGIPATVEISGRDNRTEREQMKNAAQCTQNFITLMDSLQLNVKTVEALLPGSIALIETLDKVDAVPPDFPFKEKLRAWVQKMNGMRAVDELNESDEREFLLELETSYQAFHRCLEENA